MSDVPAEFIDPPHPEGVLSIDGAYRVASFVLGVPHAGL